MKFLVLTSGIAQKQRFTNDVLLTCTYGKIFSSSEAKLVKAQKVKTEVIKFKKNVDSDVFEIMKVEEVTKKIDA